MEMILITVHPLQAPFTNFITHVGLSKPLAYAKYPQISHTQKELREGLQHSLNFQLDGLALLINLPLSDYEL